jgi:3-methyladenine DNA glycosylase AlkD
VTLYQQIVKQIREAAKTPGRSPESVDYHGNSHPHYLLSVPQERKIAKQFSGMHKDLEEKEFIALLNDLYDGKSYEEKCFGGKLLEYMPKQRASVKPKHLDIWLEKLEGWAEIDSLCQSAFRAADLLNNWKEWELYLKAFSNDKRYIQKRRASVVLLNKAVEQSNDERLACLAFNNLNNIKSEQDILITKAVSWILRSSIKNHRAQVEKYLEENKDILPKIAVRETQNKLRTGKK